MQHVKIGTWKIPIDPKNWLTLPLSKLMIAKLQRKQTRKINTYQHQMEASCGSNIGVPGWWCPKRIADIPPPHLGPVSTWSCWIWRGNSWPSNLPLSRHQDRLQTFLLSQKRRLLFPLTVPSFLNFFQNTSELCAKQSGFAGKMCVQISTHLQILARMQVKRHHLICDRMLHQLGGVFVSPAHSYVERPLPNWSADCPVHCAWFQLYFSHVGFNCLLSNLKASFHQRKQTKKQNEVSAFRFILSLLQMIQK